MSSAVESVHIIVCGRVQGVGYRHFAKQRADGYKLSGNVRNLPDRTVEVFISGPRDLLENIITDLRVGPSGCSVTDCQINWRPAARRLGEGFLIEYK